MLIKVSLLFCVEKHLIAYIEIRKSAVHERVGSYFYAKIDNAEGVCVFDLRDAPNIVDQVPFRHAQVLKYILF